MARMPCRWHALWVSALGLLASSGCAATTPYHYGHFEHPEKGVPEHVVIEKGQPNKTLDRMARVASAPARLLSMNKKVDYHELSPETAEKLKVYMEKNDLTDVYVYVNHYDPASQWQRLRENTRIAPGWRYSVGVLSFLGYTIIPNRVFGGDRYNPFTNSLYLNSDVPAVVLHEAAFAKDVHGRILPGTYAAVNELPLIALWKESRAVGDVVGYAQTQRDWETEQETYCVLYPRLGIQSTAIASPFMHLWWTSPILSVGGAAVGHVTGRTLASRCEAKHKDSTPTMPDPTTGVQQAAYLENAPAETPSMQRLPKP